VREATEPWTSWDRPRRGVVGVPILRFNWPTARSPSVGADEGTGDMTGVVAVGQAPRRIEPADLRVIRPPIRPHPHSTLYFLLA